MAPSTTSGQVEDWRKSIQQSYRTEEVNNISKILASLEPSATPASKLMLASQFENMIFTSSSSLSDYRKKITKKLKKMQKNYKATAPTSISTEELAEREKEEAGQLQRKLKALYGERLELIVKNGALTVREWQSKYGPEKASMLSKHIDNAITWAADIGVVPPEKAILVSTGKSVHVGRRTLDRMKKVASNLESRVDNIRSYVVKCTKPDLFFGEKLQEMEEDLLLEHRSDSSKIFISCIKEVLQKEGFDAQKNMPQMDVEADGGVEAITQMMDKIRAIIPIPRNGEEEKEAMLSHLDRIRISYQVCMMYTTLEPKVGDNAKLKLAGSLRKVHEAVYESINFLRDLYSEDRKREDESCTDVVLEDAWDKILEYDKDDVDAVVIGNGDVSMNTLKVRGPKPIVIRSRILFSGDRAAPANLVDALKKKQVEICNNGTATYLKLNFGDAFEMTIYFCPLLVSIRALPGKEHRRMYEKSSFRKEVIDCKLNTWKDPSFGLQTEIPSLESSSNGRTSRKRNAGGKMKQTKSNSISIMGVSGSISSLSPIISKKLEFASHQATRCLRRCFADNAGRAYKSNSDFEIEISEAMSILKFLQHARKNFQPNWEDKVG